MDKSCALIIAKSDSKRLPNKNCLDFNGKPMFLWNVLKCLAYFQKTYVSSDGDDILEIVRRFGAIPIKRPRRLCGNIPNIPVYQHAVMQMKPIPESIVAVQANSPNIDSYLIQQAKSIIEQEDYPIDEFMTVHSDKSIYGSVWALKVNKLMKYKDVYNPKPKSTLICDSIDIHTEEDFKKALCQLQSLQK